MCFDVGVFTCESWSGSFFFAADNAGFLRVFRGVGTGFRRKDRDAGVGDPMARRSTSSDMVNADSTSPDRYRHRSKRACDTFCRGPPRS